jgi:hypothetical protein
VPAGVCTAHAGDVPLHLERLALAGPDTPAKLTDQALSGAYSSGSQLEPPILPSGN